MSRIRCFCMVARVILDITDKPLAAKRQEMAGCATTRHEPDQFSSDTSPHAKPRFHALICPCNRCWTTKRTDARKRHILSAAARQSFTSLVLL